MRTSRKSTTPTTTSIRATDDPEEFVRVARQMANFAVGSQKTHPWWQVAGAVVALADIAADGGPLSEVATVALQVMATVYNEKTGGTQ